jgi:hypothetical protein
MGNFIAVLSLAAGFHTMLAYLRHGDTRPTSAALRLVLWIRQLVLPWNGGKGKTHSVTESQEAWETPSSLSRTS